MKVRLSKLAPRRRTGAAPKLLALALLLAPQAPPARAQTALRDYVREGGRVASFGSVLTGSSCEGSCQTSTKR